MRKKPTAGLAVAIVTAVFAALGAALLIVGYKDQVWSWMCSIGVSLLVVAVIPLLMFGYMRIKKKIDE